MEKLRLRRSARKDSERIEELVSEYYLKLVHVLDGFNKEEETVCKKAVDKEGNKILMNGGYSELKLDLNFYMCDKPQFDSKEG